MKPNLHSILTIKWIFSISVISFLSFHSCKQATVKDVTFPIEKELFSKSIEVPPVIYASHPGLVITGDKLVIIEPEAEQIFSIFNLPDCKYLGGFGVLGRGPEEFNDINPFSAIPSDKGIRIFDFDKGVFEIDITDFPTNVSSRNTVKFPEILQLLNSPFQINDSIICGIPYPQVGIENNKPYIRFNTNSNEIDYFGRYPELFPETNSDIFMFVFMHLTSVNPDKEKFVSVGHLVKSLTIFNSDGTLCKELIMKAPEDLIVENGINSEALVFYSAMKTTNNYIYAICENAPFNNLLENRAKLEVWDWDGNPVIQFQLDRPVSAFGVTQDDKMIYFIDRQTQDRIFTYNLDGLLK
jgi:hypothetical protein